MDDTGSVVSEHVVNSEVHRRFALRRIMWLGIGALGLGTSAFAIAVFYILRDDPQQRFFPVLLTVLYLVITFLAVSAIYDIDKIQNQLVKERRELEARIDKDRENRQDREWIDLAINSILLQMKGTIVPSEITGLLVEGLGNTLKVDFVLYFSAGEFQTRGLLNQWNRSTGHLADYSMLAEYEASLIDLAKLLQLRSRIISVDDSNLIDLTHHPFPELVAMSKVIARSWIIAPVGEAIHGMGYVWIGVAGHARAWSEVEVEFVKRIATDTAQVLAHAWMIGQSIQIADNAANVNRLVELDLVKNDFIENMNHELRTPLTSIIGYLEVIMDDVDAAAEPELVSSLTAVQRNAFRLQLLIENMMQISKTDFDMMPLAISTVDIGHLLRDLIDSMQLTAKDCNVVMTLRLDSPAGDLIIDGDVNQLEQVFVNLLANAIKFTPHDGSVTVVARRIHADGECVEVKVADTGIGIPAKEFPKVFQRFFRATTATDASIPGFGIGLYLVHSIVHQHRGTVTFDSTVGKGTVFTVTLPSRQRASRKPKVTV